MKVLPSRFRLSLRPLTACMAAALSCAGSGAVSADLSQSERDRLNIYSDGWSEGRTHDSRRIDRLSIPLPNYLRQRHTGSPGVAQKITSSPRATTLEVTNCDDAGAGSLRDTVAAATSGDTVDLSQLTCSTITLASGSIQILQDDLFVTGPGATSLAIDGAGVFQIFAHYGAGSLTVDGLTLTNGYQSSPYAGAACIYSSANVTVQNAIVSHCAAEGPVANGGAIGTLGNLTLINSIITHNRANGSQFSSGGGVFVFGDLLVQYSTISYNIASNMPPASGQFSVSGGAHTFGNVVIQNSTVVGNQAKNVAALVFEAYNNTPTALMINSTVSENLATYHGPFGGVYTAIPLTIYNSTIAFNSGSGCSGLLAYRASVTLQSSIIADNARTDLLLQGGATVSGTNNLINNAAVVPPDTIRDCPLLGPLSDNGGVTLTHALRSTSPAIDMGNNNMALVDDQRGIGFPRIFGAGADIGAVEWQGGEDAWIFNSGFESICDR